MLLHWLYGWDTGTLLGFLLLLLLVAAEEDKCEGGDAYGSDAAYYAAYDGADGGALLLLFAVFFRIRTRVGVVGVVVGGRASDWSWSG